MVRAIRLIAGSYHWLGNWPKATLELERAVEFARTGGSSEGIYRALNGLAHQCMAQGDYARVEKCCAEIAHLGGKYVEQSLALSAGVRTVRSDYLGALASVGEDAGLETTGGLKLMVGEYALAREILMRLVNEALSPEEVPQAGIALLLISDDVAQARRILEAQYANSIERGSKGTTAMVLYQLAGAALADADYDYAAAKSLYRN